MKLMHANMIMPGLCNKGRLIHGPRATRQRDSARAGEVALVLVSPARFPSCRPHSSQHHDHAVTPGGIIIHIAFALMPCPDEGLPRGHVKAISLFSVADAISRPFGRGKCIISRVGLSPPISSRPRTRFATHTTYYFHFLFTLLVGTGTQLISNHIVKYSSPFILSSEFAFYIRSRASLPP